MPPIKLKTTPQEKNPFKKNTTTDKKNQITIPSIKLF